MKLDEFLAEAEIALTTGDETVSREFLEKWIPIVTSEVELLGKQVTDLKMQCVMLETKILETEVD